MTGQGHRAMRIGLSSLVAGFGVCLVPGLLDAAVRERMAERVSAHYTARALEETGALNIVSSVLLDYRGFDTLIEATVIFAAAAAIGSLLANAGIPTRRKPLSVLVQCAISYLGPLFWIFPVTVILRGHVSPGGGFQGGVALAVLLILARIVYGDASPAPGVDDRTLEVAEAGGAAAFLAVGLVGLASGTAYLANLSAGFRAGVPGALAGAGFMLLLNAAVGCKVAASLALIQRRLDRGSGESI